VSWILFKDCLSDVQCFCVPLKLCERHHFYLKDFNLLEGLRVKCHVTTKDCTFVLPHFEVTICCHSVALNRVTVRVVICCLQKLSQLRIIKVTQRLLKLLKTVEKIAINEQFLRNSKWSAGFNIAILRLLCVILHVEVWFRPCIYYCLILLSCSLWHIKLSETSFWIPQLLF
jgi:hypothetical protein